MPYFKPATDTPFGAIPYGEVRSTRPYNKNAAGILYPGDFVIMETDGGVAIATTGSTTILGVAAEYSAAVAKTDFLVYDHPAQEYVIQDDSDTTGMTEASIGTKANITVTTGDTTLLRSKHEIDSDTCANNDATLALSIIGLHPMENRSFATTTAQQRKWIVKINNCLAGFLGRTGI